MSKPVSRSSPSLWSNNDFLKLWLGETLSLVGVQVVIIALPLTAAQTLGADASQMGILGAAQTIPALFFGLFAGAWTDRLRRKPLLIVTNLARVVCLGTIPLTAAFGMLSLLQVYIVAFLTGSVGVFFMVAYQAFLPTLVSKQALVEGNSKLRISESLAQISGSSAGGLLAQLITAPFALLVGALSPLASVVCLCLIRTPELTPKRDGRNTSIGTEVVEGLNYVKSDRTLRGMACVGVANAFFESMLAALYILFITRDIGVSPGLVGAILALGGPVALLSALVTNRSVERFGIGTVLISALTLNASGVALLTTVNSSLGIAIPLLFAARTINIASSAAYSISTFSLVQLLPPAELRGRVNATIRVFSWTSAAFGALIGGSIGQVFGLHTVFVIAAIGMLLIPVALLRSPIPYLIREASAPEVG